MKGTGRWTVQEAAELSVAAPTIAASLDARCISGRKTERVAASNVLEGPAEKPAVDKNQVIADLQGALYCAKVISYAQGMGIIKAASEKHNWNVDLSACARMWRGGCIIRAQLLGKIQHALPSTVNFLISWSTQLCVGNQLPPNGLAPHRHSEHCLGHCLPGSFGLPPVLRSIPSRIASCQFGASST
ncbi:6-Phosphogluconate dehydrogenase [Fragilaria crotonensis]|nr:6-Phosphogluconate dehydrogenase [Fragilaria crotonensis]